MTGKRVLALDVMPLPKNIYAFALSPDGSKLAILHDDIVSLYDCKKRAAD
jgi:hypothetical protein